MPESQERAQVSEEVWLNMTAQTLKVQREFRVSMCQHQDDQGGVQAAHIFLDKKYKNNNHNYRKKIVFFGYTNISCCPARGQREMVLNSQIARDLPKLTQSP